MTNTDKLRAAYETAEAKAQKIMADKDEALGKIRDRFESRLQDANQEAADAQKAWMDAEAAAALVGRDDAAIIADNLGLTLPTTE